jgi:serine-type D-Ala-D-Ala endopeptidase (penicillin-binding protein 7)
VKSLQLRKLTKEHFLSEFCLIRSANILILLRFFSILLHFMSNLNHGRAGREQMRRFSRGLWVSFLLAIIVTPASIVVAATTSRTDAKSHSKVHGKKASSSKVVKSKAANKIIVKHTSGSAKLSPAALKRKGGFHRVAYATALSGVPPLMSAGDLAGLSLTRDPLDLKSNVALVLDQRSNEVLFEKNAAVALPIASITKLMTSLVVVEAGQDLEEQLLVTEDDIDREKFSHSRLRVGSQLSRSNMLHIALMSSENRAASALGRHYPGGLPAFVQAMNAKARELGMVNSRFADSTGLSSTNVSSARDLAKLVIAAHKHPLIRQYSTDSRYAVDPGGRMLQYRNSNGLIENPEWEIGLQKTGYISEAGRCLVMQVNIADRPIVMIFLDAKSKQSRLADADRIRKWLENRGTAAISVPSSPRS